MTSFGGDSESLQLTLWEPLRFRSEVEEQTCNEQTRNDEENQPPMQPLSMYFSPNQYNKAIKLGTRCWIHKAVENLESSSLGLRPEELRWFNESILNSSNSGKCTRPSSVLGGKAKIGKGAPSVDPLFLRMVEDLDACRTFSWGRYSFDANLKEIEHTLRHFNGVVETDSWTFRGFVTPLELLPFEAIPCLKDSYREEAKGADIECPRMCKTKFRPFTLKGFPLSDLYETLGNTKDIQSILEPSADEEDMLAGIMERYEYPDNSNTIPNTWTSRIIDDGKPIFWKDMSLDDEKNRVEPAKNASSKSPAPSGIVDQIQGLKKKAIRSECLGEEKEGEEQGDEGKEQGDEGEEGEEGKKGEEESEEKVEENEKVGGEVAKKEKKKTKTKAADVRKYLTRQRTGIQEQSGGSVEEGEVQHEKKKKKSRN
ncbi:uncharacterized protein At3g43530-like [Eutrema salsugineum]|uniref:uncharacterized protein At3g43530-like n=1 Tax=Eutrema salsugineum TaxID=72664 RepID=UPI000CED357C|nr:uncharacterized protein At3g43530-like [Eutrema salsugineum]